MSPKKIIIILGLIVLLGLSLRLYDLDAEGLWLDEGGSVMKADADLKQFMSGRPPYVSPPLYYLFLDSWINVFGNSEISIRLPSVLFGILSLLLIYRIGETLFNNVSGLSAAFFLAISTFHIYFSREARMYSLLLLLALCSMYYFIDLITQGVMKGKGGLRRVRWWSALLYLLSTTLLLYTHNFGISPLIAQNILALILFFKTRRIGRMRLKSWVILQSIISLAFLPWIVVIIKQFLNIKGKYWSPPVSPGTLLETLLDYSGSYWLLVLFIAFSIIAWFIPYSNRTGQKSSVISNHKEGESPLPNFLFLFIWLLTPCLLPFLISIISTPIYISRITITASPALYLMAAGGIGRLHNLKLKIISLGLIGILAFPLLWNYYHISHKEPLREIFSRVEANVQPGDIILIMPLWYKKFVFDYYQTRKDIPARGFSHGSINARDLKELTDLIEQYRRVWIILCQGEDISLLLKKNFPIRFNPAETKVTSYFSFQARKNIPISVYILE